MKRNFKTAAVALLLMAALGLTLIACNGGGNEGGDDVCGECGQSDGNHLINCTHHADYVCDNFTDEADNTTWEQGADGLCDVCGKAENLHAESGSHSHSDSDKDGYCDDYECNSYIVGLSLPGNFTFVFDTPDGNRHTITRDLGKIHYISEYKNDGSVQFEYLYVWSDSAKVWQQYYKEDGSWVLDEYGNASNENDVINDLSGGLLTYHAYALYQDLDWAKTAIIGEQSLALAGRNPSESMQRTVAVYSDAYDCNYCVDAVTGMVLNVTDLSDGAPGTDVITAVYYAETGSLANGYDVA